LHMHRFCTFKSESVGEQHGHARLSSFPCNILRAPIYHFLSSPLRLELHHNMLKVHSPILRTYARQAGRITGSEPTWPGARRYYVAPTAQPQTSGFNVLFFGRDEFSCQVFRQLYAHPGKFKVRNTAQVVHINVSYLIGNL
jgi:hypothetical protein